MLTYEVVVEPVLVAVHPLHHHLLLEVEEDGAAEVGREVGDGCFVPAPVQLFKHVIC